MKLATFAAGGKVSYGLVVEGGLVDAGARLGAPFPDVRSVLAANALEKLRPLATQEPDYTVSEVRLLKPILNPGKFLCVGVNYADRNAEFKDGSELPKYPSLFIRWPDSLVAHEEPLVRPFESHQLDYEGEIAIVIGESGRRIAEGDALRHVAGYTICNEGSIRDWIRHGKFNVTQGKNFERSGALGPWIATPDEVLRAPLRVTTRVNGEVRQDDTTDHMRFPIPHLISYISTFCTLQPGDIIATGTPTGAGIYFDPPRYLSPGDTVEIEVSGVGILRNGVIDEERRKP